MKSAGECMDVVNAYLELGSYRAAAERCGTTPKTVRRIIARWKAGDLGRPRVSLPRGRNTDVVAGVVARRVADTRGRISAKRLLPEARAAGYTGSARNFRRLVARAKASYRRGERSYRPWVPSPGEYLLIDWGPRGA